MNERSPSSAHVSQTSLTASDPFQLQSRNPALYRTRLRSVFNARVGTTYDVSDVCFSFSFFAFLPNKPATKLFRRLATFAGFSSPTGASSTLVGGVISPVATSARPDGLMLLRDCHQVSQAFSRNAGRVCPLTFTLNLFILDP